MNIFCTLDRAAIRENPTNGKMFNEVKTAKNGYKLDKRVYISLASNKLCKHLSLIALNYYFSIRHKIYIKSYFKICFSVTRNAFLYFETLLYILKRFSVILNAYLRFEILFYDLKFFPMI